MIETNEKALILSSLNYIDLDLENVPEFLKEYKDVDFKPIKAYEQIDFKVYRYINLRNIQILLTPKNRLDSVVEKYSKAIPLSEYLDNKNEKNIVNHAKFLKMLESLNKNEIKNIEEEQLLMKDNVPFKVKYNTNYLWEIYYSEFTGKYFMIATIEDQNYNALFYLIKKQIECYKNGKDEYIFVPISYLDYTKRYLKKSEISDLEKYIWLFTKEWPQIYEVFDKENELVMHVVGKTSVYDKIKSYYKIELNTKEEAVKFYTLLKALFILRTELPHHYDFETQINAKGEIVFEFNNKLIEYKNLSKFLKEEYQNNAEKLQNIFEIKEKLDIKVEKLKEEELEKSKEYLFKEKQVATYLECRKSMFGKIKYFFKNKNGKFVRTKEKKSKLKQVKEDNEVQKNISNAIIEEKDLYTIEDLIKICIELDRINVRNKESNLDIIALEDKISTMNNKIKNATLFIEEIEEHKKSIFEFWKFANKDLALGLNSAEEIKEVQKPKKIKKIFDYEEDIEEFGIEIDSIQRNIFSDEETDSLYIGTTSQIDDINKIRNEEKLEQSDLDRIIQETKNDNNNNNMDIFDIFGNIKNDKTRIGVLANKKHRESKKDKYKILDISENITLEEYETKIKNIEKNINNCIEKTNAISDIYIYIASTEKINLSEIKMFYINPTEAINTIDKQSKINLYKIKVKEGMNIIYNTNIVYYDNINNTLPLGMNVGHTVLFDMNRYKLDLKKQKIFRINQENNDLDFDEEIICAYEYEAK